MFNTHLNTPGHFHTDLSYACIVKDSAKLSPADGETNDFCWMSAEEIRSGMKTGLVLPNTGDIYLNIMDTFLNEYVRVPATIFSTEEPTYL